LITVTDNGCAMDEVTLNQVFDPYFTTKEDGLMAWVYLRFMVLSKAATVH
jgi:hypothetical protein